MRETALRVALPRLQRFSKGPLHVARKIGQAPNEKRAQLSRLARRCIVKFSKGLGDRRPHFRVQRRRARWRSLDGAISFLLDASAARTKAAIETAGYPERPRRAAAAFARDIAALRKMSPREMNKITSKKTTIRGSLRYATSPAQLEYILNLGRFTARNPSVQVMCGATKNGALHMQLKAFFRSVFIQAERNARAVCSICTFAKLLAGWARGSLPRLSCTGSASSSRLRLALSLGAHRK
eukprot:9332501-Pyramimonas_sp.AAC.1